MPWCGHEVRIIYSSDVSMPNLIGLLTAHPDLVLVIPHHGLCAYIYSRGFICHSSVGCAVWLPVIPRASQTNLPGGWDIILYALIIGFIFGCIGSVLPCISPFSRSAWILPCMALIFWSCTCCMGGPSASVSNACMPTN